MSFNLVALDSLYGKFSDARYEWHRDTMVFMRNHLGDVQIQPYKPTTVDNVIEMMEGEPAGVPYNYEDLKDTPFGKMYKAAKIYKIALTEGLDSAMLWKLKEG